MPQPTATRHSSRFRRSRPLGLLAAILLTTTVATAQSQPLLPEFTPAMAAAPLFTWPHQTIVLTPLNGTGWVAGSEPGGQIALFSPRDGSARLSLFPGGVDRVLAIGGFRLLISNGSEWTLLDADTGHRQPAWSRLLQGQVLGGGEGLVLLDRGAALALVAPETGEVLGEIDKAGSEPGSPWFGPAEVVVPLGDRLAIFDRQKRTWRKRLLPAQVTSGVLVTDDCVYVGLAPRTLACIERESGLVRWRRPLVQPLRDTPMAVGEWIAAFPEDHNLYFFKTQGTLHWWAPLRALPRFPPVATREAVVVSVLDGPLHVFDPKRKLALTWNPPNPLAGAPTFVAPGSPPPSSPAGSMVSDPLGALILPLATESQLEISRLTNRITIDIALAPAAPLETGRPVTITLTPCNLKRPEIHLRVSTADGVAQLERHFHPGAPLTAVWLPTSAGEYRVLATVTKGTPPIESVLSVQVIDRQAQRSELRYWLLQNAVH